MTIMMNRQLYFLETLSVLNKKCLSWSTVYVVLLWSIDFYANLTVLSTTLFEKKSKSPINASRFNKALLVFAKSTFFAAPSLIVPVIMWFETSKLEMYLQEWADFQIRYSNLIGNSSISKTIRVQVIQLFRSILIILIAFGTTLMLTTTKTNFLQLFCTMKSVSTMAYITTFWFVSTKIIIETTEEFKNKLQTDIKNPIYAATIEEYRLLWIHMSKLIRESGYVISGTMSFCIFYTTIFAILTVYVLTVWGSKLVEQKDYTTLILAFAACIVNTMSLYIYCNSGYKQTKKVE
ncbi:gustatory and odorant receptor 63a-like [Adelges cooleyi]|uniref:gustatory and odorant receptor 63a-like n=1 Tax=Adelges cooleyi TaxID=133065 RepID=UPI00217FC690|nr:gustatory and odorant receptor 63a-like [Adelges cooleyi]